MEFKSIVLNSRQLNDFELITNGSFYPLTGFMNQNDYTSCLEEMNIKEGFFPLPIVLCINEKQKNELTGECFVYLRHPNGLNLGLMEISDKNSIYTPNIEYECKKIYGSYDLNHPYIKVLNQYINDGFIYNIGGKIIGHTKIPHYDFKDLRMTPVQTQKFFAKNNWKCIIGFQTRNPLHKSHFALTKYALGQIPDAKLLLHPVIGETQDCDIEYYKRIKCYKHILKYYDENVVKLALLPLSMRMAGPKECLLHALIRSNYGCTHFIVGRFHASPSVKKQDGSEFFSPYEAQKMLIKYHKDIGIIPIISKEIVYAVPINEKDENKGIYTGIDKVDKNYKVVNISGTEIRNMLTTNTPIPEWFSFPEIIKELQTESKGLCLYFVGLSGAGKTTLTNFTSEKLREFTNKKITILDGDEVRQNLSKGLGFSKEDRSINIRRIGYVCSEIVKHGGIVLVANIAPYKEDRDYNRKIISEYGHYIEIFIDAKLETCEKRDVKGLYKLARKGVIKEFTGISSDFETPTDSEIILEDSNTVDQNINTIFDYLIKNNKMF